MATPMGKLMIKTKCGSSKYSRDEMLMAASSVPLKRRDSWPFCRQLLSSNYCVLTSFVAFVAVSYLLTAHFHLKDQELDNIKKFLQVMEVQTLFQEVDQVEKACMTVASDLRYLQQCCMRSMGTAIDTPSACPKVDDSTKAPEQFSGIYRLVIPKNTSSYNEITILSFIYTTSFDKKKHNFKNGTAEVFSVT